MEIQELTEFKLKINLIVGTVDKKVTLPQILPTFRPSLAQILSKIAKFETISNYYDLKHGNTSTDRGSSKNYTNW